MRETPTFPRSLHSVGIGDLVDGLLLGIAAAEDNAANDNRTRILKKTSSERVHELRTMSYEDYMESSEWRLTSEKVCEAAGNECAICGGDRWLNAHHLTYERRGREWWSDLIVLCHDCHYTFHRRMPNQHTPKGHQA